MLFYIKIDGKLVEASLEQVMDPELELYGEDGKKINRPEVKVLPDADAEPDADTDDEDLSKLDSALTDLTGAVNGLGDKFKQQEEDITKLKTSVQKGFVIPNPDGSTAQHTDNDNEIMQFIGKRWDRRKQGISLQSHLPAGISPFKKGWSTGGGIKMESGIIN